MADDAVAFAAIVIPAGEDRRLLAELFWVFRDVLSDHVWMGGRGQAYLLEDRAGYDADLSVEAIQPAESDLDIVLQHLGEAGDGQEKRDDEEANHWFRYPRVSPSMPPQIVLGKSNAAATKARALSIV